MNIPDEAEKRYGKPEDAENDVRVALSLGFKTGAEWARKEALREAASIVRLAPGLMVAADRIDARIRE